MNVLMLVLKLVVSFGFMFWLVSTGKLDIGALLIYYERPYLAILLLIYWFVSCVYLCGLRWHFLMQGLNLKGEKVYTFMVNAIGLFFTAIAPGMIGGDVIKGYYIQRLQSKGHAMTVILSLIMDRIVGVYILFFAAVALMAVNYQSILGLQSIWVIASSVILVFLGLTFILILAMSPRSVQNHKASRVKWILGYVAQIKFMERIFEALSVLKTRPDLLFKSIAVGSLHQIFTIILFYQVTVAMETQSVDLGLLGMILPVGMVLVALPISPGGLGVGHLAFEQLYRMIGLENGANIFHVVFMGQLALNMIGMIPYLCLKYDKRKNNQFTEPHLI